ncbi:MAG: hypothetical protein EZS28_034504 [Streblomastix strix]|uniref:Uncharacterized protein n=1 Tax=Streblomastix strix TaxID=222440 RepID=A0A5J4UHF3_9EUKA|nr:MAG: hypothetical protein EZS28_034504 [Streblomastix strix]
MQSKQKIQVIAKAIISFTDSYTYNKQGKRNEQSEFESTLQLAYIVSTLQSLENQIQYNNALKQIIKTKKLLKSLIALTKFRLGTHIDLDVDRQRLEVRSGSQRCLSWIQCKGDEQIQTELINNGYGRVISIQISTAGGIGEEQDWEIFNGFIQISNFLRALHQGRNNYYQPSFQPLPLLARRSEEQIEEEGANEEIEAQMNNKGNYGNIKYYANSTKSATLNHFIHRN